MTKQARWKAKQRSLGRCVNCGRKSDRFRCKRCRAKVRPYQREIMRKRRLAKLQAVLAEPIQSATP